MSIVKKKMKLSFNTWYKKIAQRALIICTRSIGDAVHMCHSGINKFCILNFKDQGNNVIILSTAL